MYFTEGQKHALEVFTTGDNLLLLGDSGTGKSTLIKEFVTNASARGKRVALTASTGIASELIGGITIHSLTKAFPGMQMYSVDYAEKTERLKDIDILIIDEISMLGASFINYLFWCLSHVDHKIQLVIIGDFFQLPPVNDNYAFTSPYWNSLGLIPCKLTEVIRQDDAEFIRNLNMLKYGDKRCLSYLISNSSPSPLPGQISICATRESADRINRTEFEKLLGAPQVYAATYEGKVSESSMRIELCLLMKEGMRVMAITNGPGYSNGSLGTVVDMTSDYVTVKYDNGNIVSMERARFTVDRIDIPGETTEIWQIPLRAASAITIHKSQGQTFQHVNIDGTRCWAPGQLYVAVSRARSIQGIHFLTPIRECNVLADPKVIEYYKSLDIN